MWKKMSLLWVEGKKTCGTDLPASQEGGKPTYNYSQNKGGKNEEEDLPRHSPKGGDRQGKKERGKTPERSPPLKKRQGTRLRELADVAVTKNKKTRQKPRLRLIVLQGKNRKKKAHPAWVGGTKGGKKGKRGRGPRKRRNKRQEARENHWALASKRDETKRTGAMGGEKKARGAKAAGPRKATPS